MHDDESVNLDKVNDERQMLSANPEVNDVPQGDDDDPLVNKLEHRSW